MLFEKINWSRKCSEYSQCGMFFVALFGLFFAWQQLEQLHEQQRWQNYSELNARYANLYKELPYEIIRSDVKLEHLSPVQLRSVRQYFDLYSEEYWLYKNNLIPEEMWTLRIRNGVTVNLTEYPILIQGYRYWKEKGAFKHPVEFQTEVENVIAEICVKQSKLRYCQ